MQDDIKSIVIMVDMLVVEIDLWAFEEYISTGSKTPTASCLPKMAGTESHAHAQLSHQSKGG